jgi:Ankyrin repeat
MPFVATMRMPFAISSCSIADTAPMAIHRGRIDLLERHLARDADLLFRTFTHDEIYPPELGCHTDHSLALHATPLAGATLLHLCVDYDEIDIARWLIARGADVNVRAEVDEEGFGDHTGCVVTQPIRLRYDDVFARLLLDHGADPNVRTSLRKQLRGVDDESMHEYCDVTALAWGSRFHHELRQQTGDALDRRAGRSALTGRQRAALMRFARRMIWLRVRSTFLRALAGLALVSCASTNTTHSASRYVVTDMPIDIGIRAAHFCVAVDPTDAHGAWWWEPGRSGCSTRSTGPDVFRAEAAAVTARSGQGPIDVRFRVQLHQSPGSSAPAFLDVALRIDGSELIVLATGARTAVGRRDTLQIPESPGQ